MGKLVLLGALEIPPNSIPTQHPRSNKTVTQRNADREEEKREKTSRRSLLSPPNVNKSHNSPIEVVNLNRTDLIVGQGQAWLSRTSGQTCDYSAQSLNLGPRHDAPRRCGLFGHLSPGDSSRCWMGRFYENTGPKTWGEF